MEISATPPEDPRALRQSKRSVFEPPQLKVFQAPSGAPSWLVSGNSRGCRCRGRRQHLDLKVSAPQRGNAA
ncbi:MAG: hypothetical protein RLY23_121, partial [Actinomycetota bacterium]